MAARRSPRSRARGIGFSGLAGAFALIVGTFSWGSAVQALPEGERWAGAGVDLGYSASRGPMPRGSATTAGLTLELQHGVTDVVAGRAALSAGRWLGDARRTDMTFALGAAFAYDVLRIVPFFEIGVTGIYALADENGSALGLETGLGADYLLDRWWSVGLSARGRLLPVRFGAEPATAGGTVTLRLGRRFY